MTSDQGLPVVSLFERPGNRNGEIGGGFGKLIDSAEYERFSLRLLSSNVSDTRIGALDTRLNVLDSETVCGSAISYGRRSRSGSPLAQPFVYDSGVVFLRNVSIEQTNDYLQITFQVRQSSRRCEY